MAAITFGMDEGRSRVALYSFHLTRNSYYLCGLFQEMDGIDPVAKVPHYGQIQFFKKITVDGIPCMQGDQKKIEAVVRRVLLAIQNRTGKATRIDGGLVFETNLRDQS